MRVLIFGGTGMLGHKLWRTLSKQTETHITVRHPIRNDERLNVFDPKYVHPHISAQDFDGVIRVIQKVEPAVVINCIGIVKQQQTAKDPLISIAVNALFPHRLAEVCGVAGIRLIHISTDCVFSGRTGNYVESDVSDAEDLYGRTKYLGEVTDKGCLTLRTSIIGHELESTQGLLEWFLSQHGHTVHGYKQSRFSGLTTNALANIIEKIIIDYPNMDGLWHVAASPIDKFTLLSLIKNIYRANIEIEQDNRIVVDRSLNADRFNKAVGFTPASWQTMIDEMHTESASYRRT